VSEVAPVRWGMGDIFYGLLVVLVANVAVGLALVAADVDGTVVVVTASVVANAIGFAGWPAVATWRKGRRSLVRDFGLAATWGDVGWGLIGFVILLAWQMAAAVVWLLVRGGAGGDGVPTNTDFLPESPSLATIAVLVVALAVVTPVIEELFFRGLALRAVGRRLGPVWAVAVSSVLFGLLHGLGGGWEQAIFIVIVTTGFGVAMGVLTAWRGRLGSAIVAHVLLNALAVGVASLPA
jgi:membrane protease YdiL (CAAX protease family)